MIPAKPDLLPGNHNSIQEEAKLREILSMPDSGVEFARYAEPNLPVCGIGFEEALKKL